jgi:hypothetical protein
MALAAGDNKRTRHLVSVGSKRGLRRCTGPACPYGSSVIVSFEPVFVLTESNVPRAPA